MPTTKKRDLITLTPATSKVISRLAKEERIPRSTKIAQIVNKAIEDYLEDQEDRYMSKKADEAYEAWEKSGKKVYSHEEAWGISKKREK